MAVRRVNQLAMAEHPAQNQAAMNHVLSPRSTMNRLLSMEASMDRMEATLQEVLQ